MPGKTKRGQCDNCPSVKRVVPVKIAGDVRISLCEACRLALSKIVRDQAAQKEAAAARA